MRITYKHDIKNYLANYRISIIQKSHESTHNNIQLINNRLVDKKILDWDNELASDIYDPYDEDNIYSDIINYNRSATQKDLQRLLLNSPLLRNVQTELEALKVINSVGDTLTSLETSRILKNLKYIEDILTDYDIDINKYKEMVNRLPPNVSRDKILNRCLTTDEGEDYTLPVLRQHYAYRELNELSKILERYKTNRLDYEKSVMINNQAVREGYSKVNQTKTWIWSTLEKTRHHEMDGETVPLNEKFTVINELTGDVDYLMFPGDVANDQNNCSNICNCGCSYEIN